VIGHSITRIQFDLVVSQKLKSKLEIEFLTDGLLFLVQVPNENEWKMPPTLSLAIVGCRNVGFVGHVCL
jgi:hypothetical protein